MNRSRSLVTLALSLACAAVIFSPATSAQAQTVTNFANFDGQDGRDPTGSVVQATDGNFYGSTFVGGAHDAGSVYRLTPGGQLTSIYSFCSQAQCADGKYGVPAPILGSDGNLYGVTTDGGSTAHYSTGSGIVYKVSLSGQFTILHTFCSTYPCVDGEGPDGMVQGFDGNFYGVTYVGGQFNAGTIFAISPTGKFRVLHSFCSSANCLDGQNPYFPPIQGNDGNLYGVTLGGGTLGPGVAYQLSPSGTLKVLHNFCYGDGCDGSQSNQLAQDAKGNLFGTTVMGGANGHGTIFEITTKNQYVVLDNFDYVRGAPSGGLSLANDGNFYGTTGELATGQHGGTVFKVSPAGRYTQLYTFDISGGVGYNPSSLLVQGTDGILYGTTIYGGDSDNDGTVYKLSNVLSPLVKTVPAGGKVGKHVLILGNGLIGTTSVTFNGVPATFTVESDTFIRATVPAGAATGTVSVVTPSGTLNSYPQFVVTK